MYVERSMKLGERSLEEDGNVTDLEERETNEELRFVNLWPHLSLLMQRANDRNRCVEQCEELMEGVSPLILLYSVVAIAL